VGIVFAPTLNIPAPLISLFVLDHEKIFGTPLDISSSDYAVREPSNPELSVHSVRSPRKQMFSDLSTPAHNQTTFPQNEYSQASEQREASNTGFSPVQQSYAQLSGRQQGDGGYGSLDDALSDGQGPARYQYGKMNSNNSSSSGLSAPTSRQSKRESSTFFMTSLMSPREPSLSQLNENEALGGSF